MVSLHLKPDGSAAELTDLLFDLAEPACGDQQIETDLFVEQLLTDLYILCRQQWFKKSQEIIVKAQPKMQHRMFFNRFDQGNRLLRHSAAGANKPARTGIREWTGRRR